MYPPPHALRGEGAPYYHYTYIYYICIVYQHISVSVYLYILCVRTRVCGFDMKMVCVIMAIKYLFHITYTHTHTYAYNVYDDDARLWVRNQVNNALTRKNAQISISFVFRLHKHKCIRTAVHIWCTLYLHVQHNANTFKLACIHKHTYDVYC